MRSTGADAGRARLGRATLVVGVITLASRVTGVVRDAVLALLLGASFANDLFQLAFELPNFARRVVGDSSFAPLILPLHDRLRRAERGVAGRDAVAALTFQGTALFLALGAAAAATVALAAPLVARLLLPAWSALGEGATAGEARGLAVALVRTTAPYLALLLPITFLSALLQAEHRFYRPALGGLPLNLLLVVMAGAIVAAAGPLSATTPESVVTTPAARTILFVLAAGVLVGGAGRLALLLGGVGRAAWTPRREPDLRGELWRVARRAAPALAVLAVPQLYVSGHLLLATLLGPALAAPQELEGLLSRLRYAHRIMEFPLAIVAGSLATTLVPSLFAGAGDDAAPAAARGGAGPHLRTRLFEAFDRLLRLTLPATAGLVLLAEPTVALLFQRGAWSAADSAASGAYLAVYALALPALGFGLLLAPAALAFAGARGAARDGLAALVLGCAASAGLAAATGRLEALPLGIVVAEAWRARRAWGRLAAAAAAGAEAAGEGAAAAGAEAGRGLAARTAGYAAATVVMAAAVAAARGALLPEEVVAAARAAELGPRLAAAIALGAAGYFGALAALGALTPAARRRSRW